MSSQQEAKVPGYLKDIRAAGLQVSDYEARRFRAILLNFDYFTTLIKERMRPVDVAWLRSIISGSEGFLLSQQEDNMKDYDILMKARNQLLDIVESKELSQKEKAEQTSAWLLHWVSEKGLLKLRTAINGYVAGQKRRRSPISVYQQTRDRFNDVMATSSAQSADEMLNDMIDAYLALHKK